MKKSRAKGYYWVYWVDKWYIGEYTDHFDTLEWYLTGMEMPFDDSDFEEIDETKIERNDE